MLFANFLLSRSQEKEEMAFMLRKVSVASVLYVMSYLAVYCDAAENKTGKQPSYVTVCCLRHEQSQTHFASENVSV